MNGDASSPYAPRIEQTPDAVRAALDPDQRELFDAEVAAAGAASAEVVDRWWGIAQIQAKGPGTRQRIEASSAAFARGEPFPAVPADDETGEA
jgi:hypothetical protein